MWARSSSQSSLPARGAPLPGWIQREWRDTRMLHGLRSQIGIILRRRSLGYVGSKLKPIQLASQGSASSWVDSARVARYEDATRSSISDRNHFAAAVFRICGLEAQANPACQPGERLFLGGFSASGEIRGCYTVFDLRSESFCGGGL